MADRRKCEQRESRLTIRLGVPVSGHAFVEIATGVLKCKDCGEISTGLVANKLPNSK